MQRFFKSFEKGKNLKLLIVNDLVIEVELGRKRAKVGESMRNGHEVKNNENNALNGRRFL